MLLIHVAPTLRYNELKDMSEGDSPRFPVVLSAGVTQDMADRVEAEGRDDESQSATVRRLIKEGLEHNGQKSRIVTTAGYIVFAAVPTYFAHTGELHTAVGVIVVTTLAFLFGNILGQLR